MAFPNISDLVATTIEYRSKALADNVTSHNALFAQMNEKGNVAPASGGTVINENFSFAENSNGGSYSGYDQLPTGAADVISGAQFQWTQYAVPVTFSGRESAINSGGQALIDLVKARVKVAESTMKNLLNRHLYLDGTGNNGKNLTGLAAAVPLSPTNTYGGIDRSQAANAFWKNQKYQASVDGSGVATSSTILAQWNSFILTLTRGGDRPSIILAAPGVFATYQGALQNMQHIYDASKASAGFKAIDYQGIPVVFDTAASGITSTYAYFLNTDYLHLRPHADRNFVALDDKSSLNQDATVKTLVWMGNLTCSGAKFQGVYSNS